MHLITTALTVNFPHDPFRLTNPLPLPKLVTFPTRHPPLLSPNNHRSLLCLLLLKLNKNAWTLFSQHNAKRKVNVFFVEVLIIGQVFVPNVSQRLCSKTQGRGRAIRHKVADVVHTTNLERGILDLDCLALLMLSTKQTLLRKRTLVGRLRLQTGEAPSYLGYLF